MKLLNHPRVLLAMVALCLTGSLSALEIKGHWIQGGMLIGQVAPGERVQFTDRNVRVDDDGLFVLGLGRDAPSAMIVTVTDKQGAQQSHSFAVEQREYNIQRVEGVPPRTVNPPAEEMERIQNESRLTRNARAQDLPRRDFLKTIEWPVLGPISGVYGSQRVYNGEPRRPHFGVDIARPTGTEVSAPLPGVVALAYDNMFFSGGTLILDHGHGITSTFIHLSKIVVKEGEEIQQGQTIAEIGATGRVTGPHLDWRMNWFNHPLDPQLLVEPMPDWQEQH